MRRFLREATAAARISGHPHVISLYDCGMTRDDRPYLVMELCPNGSLADLLRNNGPLAPDDTLDLGLAVCGALAAAHDAGILHRDVKPSNVLIDAYGTPRLSDFGLAAMPVEDQPVSVTLEALTPAFAAPESFAALEPSRQSDVWSMGATLHAMITSDSPRRGRDGTPSPLSELMTRLADPLPAPTRPGYEGLMEIVRTATAYEPSDRYAGAGEMYDALRELRERRGAAAPGGLVVGGPEATFARLPDPAVPSPPAPRVRRWPALLAVGVAGAALGAGLTLGGLALTPDRASSLPSVVATTTAPVASATPSGSASLAATPASVKPASEAPPIGGCWGGILVATGRVSAEALDCGRPHRWETYANGRLAETTTSSTRSAATDDPVVRATCTRATLRGYLDGSRGSFRTEVIPPTETQFAAGERRFACVATVESGKEQTGSLRDR